MTSVMDAKRTKGLCTLTEKEGEFGGGGMSGGERGGGWPERRPQAQVEDI